MSVVVASLSEFDDFFSFFDLKPQFRIDRQELESSYLTVQKAVHPDLHATGSESEKRISMQLATFANGAYRTLKDPISRGLYICSKNGIDPQLETNTSMPAEFLMQQMEWREKLEDARDQALKLDSLYVDVEKTYQNVLLEVEMAIDLDKNYSLAAEKLRSLLFIDKFRTELEEVISA
jgi:molecular chaperone HscB